MKINEILLESTFHGLPALETVYEDEWDSAPIKHYSPRQALDIHNSEELPDINSFNHSLVKYTGQQGAKWNNFLHKQYRGKAKPADIKKYQKNIATVDSTLAKNILKKDYVLYTGLRESPADAFNLYKHPRSTPIPVHLPAYTSTTTNWKIAVKFAGINHGLGAGARSQHELLSRTGKKLSRKPADIEDSISYDMLRIFVPAGTTGGSLAHRSHHNEDEILLPRGLDIIISPKPQIIKENPYYIIYVWNAKVVGHRPQPIEIVQKA